MRKYFFLYVLSLCLIVGLSFSTFGQQSSVGHSPKSSFLNPQSECTGQGELIYDDGTFENGYGWLASVTDGAIVMQFTPTSYPYPVGTFCAALTRNGATDTWNFNIVVYDNTGAGGQPGNLVATIPSTASGIPSWPTLAWYDFDLSSVPALNSGSYYIGLRWDASIYTSFFIGSDESTTTTHNPAYATADGGVTWDENQVLWPDYKAMGMRTLGGIPCSVEAASNPNPADYAIDVNVNIGSLTWSNGAEAVSNEVYFGTNPSDLTLIQSGSLATSCPISTLNYFTTYYWRVKEVGETCTTSGPLWSFKTQQNPNLLILDFYPQSAEFWTGNTEGTTKTDGEIITVDPNVGWAVYDISSIPQFSQIQNVIFYGYVNATNYPWWSATPMGSINPITGDAASINDQIQASYEQTVAYIYANETSSFTTGWHNYPMVNTAIPDLQAAVDAGQGWFAMGFVDRDFSTTYFVNFDGWSQTNPPYIEITYIPTPVELTAFRADVNGGSVVLNWQTATETNNKGFEVQRNSGKGYEVVGFVQGNGTSTEMHNYSFVDKNVTSGSLTYRLRQVDFNGKSEYSQEVSANVELPKVYSLSQNYPNPFNPTTQINFNLAVDSKVTLKIFDVLGQEVTRLLNGNMTSGQHNVTFDASHLNSGVYLYKLEAAGVDGSSFTSVKKMVLTK